ncbi:MAG: hypothetical protein V4773_27340 [Verrucomicrobiota bacterium]
MDDELQQFEAELKGLRPAAPSPALVARVEQALAQPARFRPRRNQGNPIYWMYSIGVAAAAALAMTLFSPESRLPGTNLASGTALAVGATTHTKASGAVLKPIAAENVLVAAQDEGLVTLDDGTPARRARLTYVDTITWKNPRTNASLTWTVPREEVRIVPVSFQ